MKLSKNEIVSILKDKKDEFSNCSMFLGFLNFIIDDIQNSDNVNNVNLDLKENGLLFEVKNEKIGSSVNVFLQKLDDGTFLKKEESAWYHSGVKYQTHLDISKFDQNGLMMESEREDRFINDSDLLEVFHQSREKIFGDNLVVTSRDVGGIDNNIKETTILVRGDLDPDIIQDYRECKGYSNLTSMSSTLKREGFGTEVFRKYLTEEEMDKFANINHLYDKEDGYGFFRRK